MKKIETQYTIILYVFIVLVTVVVYVIASKEGGNLPSTMLVPSLINLLAFLLFYKLDLKITDKKELEISFGIGIIKKKIALDKISVVKLQNIPFWYGVGIRVTPDGDTLYNTRWGKGVLLRTKSTKTFLISVNDIENFKKQVERP